MNKKLITKRLKMLLKLIEKTQPDSISESHLFQPNHSDTIYWIDRMETDTNIGSGEIAKIMKRANQVWKLRNKIKNGEIDNIEEIEISETVMDYLRDGQKINAIKYYRNEMKVVYGEEKGLKESKEYVDAIEAHGKVTGVLSR